MRKEAVDENKDTRKLNANGLFSEVAENIDDFMREWFI